MHSFLKKSSNVNKIFKKMFNRLSNQRTAFCKQFKAILKFDKLTKVIKLKEKQ